MKSFCEWKEEAHSKRTNFSRCAYYFLAFKPNHENLTEEERDEILMACKDRTHRIYNETDLVNHLLEYEAKDVVYDSDEECDRVDIETRVFEYEPRYIFWALIMQTEDYAEVIIPVYAAH